MDLPTYTNIWRIEKRLYKLYDLRLPMPLPIVWIGVFVGVIAPWSLLLALVGLPFDAPWHVVYLVPPGVVTWLSTRPVIESKRLTELLQSQARYLGEPRTWCRMAPAAEPAEITLTGRVWRAAPQPAAQVRVKAARRARHAQPKRATAKRVPVSSRAVRPAVAAAAAAAATAPVTRDRAVWDAAPTSRAGTAPALGQAVPAIEAPLPVERPVPVARVEPIAPADPGPPPAEPETAPATPAGSETAPATPIEPQAASAASAGQEDAPAADAVPERVPAASAEAASAVPAGPEPAPDPPPAEREAAQAGPAPVTSPSGEPAEQAAPGTVTPPEKTGAEKTGAEKARTARGAPIDTEALRRLRKLAVSAERAAEPAEPAGQPERPPAPRIMPQFVAPAPTGPGTTGVRADTDEDLRAQHRKGQPPPAGQRTGEDRAERRFPAARDAGTRPAEQASPQRRDTGARPAEQASPAGRGTGRDEKAWPPERPAIVPGNTSGNVSIRAVPSGPAAHADPGVPVPGPGRDEAGPAREARVRRVEAVVGRDSEGGWRRLAQVVMGPGSGGRTDGSEIDEARARGVFSGSRRVIVLGCTGGAGQTTTALMLGHTLARYREDRVLAIDAAAGPHSLSGRVRGESPETLGSLLAGLGNVHGYLGMRAYTSRCASGLEVLAGDAGPDAEQRLADRALFSDQRLGQALDVLDPHYKLVVVDPAAALAARFLPHADQLVLVVPASEDGPDAVAMTYEWLDGHGCAHLRRRAVMVVNGVSRRSMADVEQAEAVARGRCRAIVRVPWEDELAPGRSDRVEPSHLRAPGRRAYLALAGVVVSGFGAARTARTSEEEVAQ
ncbi:hypothetical protein HS041_00065 [Planomonospora sp. ID67723]|uniref:TcpE family conjugal transfer membrane protein n=1 Tax=Planomonospora sp. ID67723 TaxID=2738134 RepID=UPI0018C37951|nr:TcpE family conjugal transfer membrane protein [Planomonospora sp. ID67723]MBG0826179.1 hypothetical protein [Planomonospora sp. ID67723]